MPKVQGIEKNPNMQNVHVIKKTHIHMPIMVIFAVFVLDLFFKSHVLTDAVKNSFCSFLIRFPSSEIPFL